MLSTLAKKLKHSSVFKSLAGVASIAAFLYFTPLYGASQSKTEKTVKERNSIINSRLQEKCIDWIKVFGENPEKRNLYIIFQKHPSSKLGLDEKEKAIFYLVEGVFKNQVCVYRILEDLFKNKNLELIVSEGLYYDDYADITYKDKNFKNIFPESIEAIEKGNNKPIINYVYLKDRPSSELIGVIYPELYVIGFEDKAIKTPDRPLGFLDTRKQRSMNALKYALKHSEEFYKKGITKNKDAAIVIGGMHILDYKEITKKAEKGETDYNLIYIFLRGILRY